MHIPECQIYNTLKGAVKLNAGPTWNYQVYANFKTCIR